jgi:hypothetical protein
MDLEYPNPFLFYKKKRFFTIKIYFFAKAIISPLKFWTLAFKEVTEKSIFRQKCVDSRRVETKLSLLLRADTGAQTWRRFLFLLDLFWVAWVDFRKIHHANFRQNFDGKDHHPWGW